MKTDTRPEPGTDARSSASLLGPLVAALAGVILEILVLVVFRPLQRRSVLDPQTLPHYRLPWLEAYMKALQWIQTWPQGVALFLIFLSLAIWRRKEKMGWTWALLVGILVPAMLFQFFSRT